MKNQSELKKLYLQTKICHEYYEQQIITNIVNFMRQTAEFYLNKGCEIYYYENKVVHWGEGGFGELYIIDKTIEDDYKEVYRIFDEYVNQVKFLKDKNELRRGINRFCKITLKTLNKIKDIRRRIAIVQRDFDIEIPMYINSFYSPLIEGWVNGAEWEDIISQVEMGEGDVVRTFKRAVDVLRQITILPDINPDLVQHAREAITAIMREPIDVD